METRTVIIRNDDRARLLSAVLAGTTHPDQAQARKKHGTHLHARTTRAMLQPYRAHPAVHMLQAMLDQGIPLSALFGYVLRLSWPTLRPVEDTPGWVAAGWHDRLLEFYHTATLSQWWHEEAENWQTPIDQLQEVFSKVKLHDYLEQFVGPIKETLILMPNISYPTDHTVGCRVGGDMIALMPPPIAWGDSAPWPYKDDPGLAYRAAIAEFGTMLMSAYLSQHAAILNTAAEKPLPIDEKYKQAHPTWQDQFLGLFQSSITALFLEDAVSTLEARSYVQYMQRIENLHILPGAISVFRRYLTERSAGKYTQFIDYVPNIPKYLRVVKALAPA
jgi:hypothetical protein